MRSLHCTRELVSVVSGCRNEARTIRSFLASLAAQQCDGFTMEVIFADGESTDGTRAALEEFARSRACVQVIDNQQHIVSAGLNAAIRLSRGSVIARMDAHSEYAPDYLASCLAVLRTRNAAMVGGPVRPLPGTYWQNATGLAYRSRFFSGGSRVYDIAYEGPVESVPYGCWPKSVLDDVGLFDEKMARNQDDELSLRIQKAGGMIWQSPTIRSWYSPRATPVGLARQFFGYGFWKVYTMRKHHLVVSTRHIVPAIAVLAGFLLTCSATVAAPIRWALLFMAMTYAAAVLSVSIALLQRIRYLQLLPGLLFVFPVAHVSYGTGTLVGLLRLRSRK